MIISKEEEQFQSSNTCWIWKKLIDDDDEKVRYHCHVTSKFRGTARWKRVLKENLRGCNSHLTFCELNKSDVKIDVIPNRLEKYMTFF